MLEDVCNIKLIHQGVFMPTDKSDEVIGKLGKVADSLETASAQLTGVVTQQQLDIARERISKCEEVDSRKFGQ